MLGSTSSTLFILCTIGVLEFDGIQFLEANPSRARIPSMAHCESSLYLPASNDKELSAFLGSPFPP